MNVLLLFGGQSPEHEVSQRSAATVIDGLTRAGHTVHPCYITKAGQWLLVVDAGQTTGEPIMFDATLHQWQVGNRPLAVDVAFIIVHGTTGEDGQLQQHLEQTGTPYVGCSAAVSALCFDKVQTKQRLAEHDIAVTPGIVLETGDPMPDYRQLQQDLGDTLFVKPARCGSSIGVSKVGSAQELAAAMEEAFVYDSKILVEQAVAAPRELEVGVLEAPNGKLHASGVGEIFLGDVFYSYDDKYAADSQATTALDADLPRELRALIRDTAVKTAEALGCRGLVRVDFLYSTTSKTLYVNEVNTLPGFTSISMYPKLWEAAGLTLPQLCDRLVCVAVLQSRR